MKPNMYPKSFLSAILSVLILFSAPALAQDASATLDAAESWDEATAVHIAFNGDTVDIAGDGAALSNGILTIDTAGTYVFSGTWNNGRVCIDTNKDDTVHLVFSGVSIHCQDSAPLYAPQADKVIITLVKDTKNTLSDGGAYTYSKGETEPDAALYIQDSLTINGRGSLTVTANFKHGIVSKDGLLIQSGILSVTAADVGIRGRDMLEICGGEITVNSKGDALQSNNGDNSEKGQILLTGGTYRLTSEKDGIQAESSLTISGGDYTLYTGSITTAQGQMRPDDWQPDDSSADVAGKGLKAGSNLNISGGTFALFCANDAISAKGDITIQDGTFLIATKDDGLRADGAATIAGGKLTFQTCFKGIKASGIFISGGMVDVSANDDGFDSSDSINAGPVSEEGNQMEDTLMDKSSVRITGGDVIVKALGDGIDSNGNVLLEGGTLTVICSAGNNNSAIDFDGAFLISGGSLTATGCFGSVKVPNPDSTQPSLMVSFPNSVKAGSKIAVTSESGDTVFFCAPTQDFQSLLISASGLIQDKNYTLSVDGETLFTTELLKTVTVVSEDGSPTEGGM